MLYREIIAVCSEIHTKHINTLCGQNAEFVNVKPGGTCSNHWALKDWTITGSGLKTFSDRYTERKACPVHGMNAYAGVWI
jgi:hypothetical protein